jgi:hypothetical protein
VVDGSEWATRLRGVALKIVEDTLWWMGAVVKTRY